MKVIRNKNCILVRLVTTVLIVSFLWQDIAFAGGVDNNYLAPKSGLTSFGLSTENISIFVMAVKRLKGAVYSQDGARIEFEIIDLNKLLAGHNITIKGTAEYLFKCSSKKISYAVFSFGEKKADINVLFAGHAGLSSKELAELGIGDSEKHHLDCPGLEGVWFVESGKMDAGSNQGAEGVQGLRRENRGEPISSLEENLRIAEEAAEEATKLFDRGSYEAIEAGLAGICAKYGGKYETIHGDLVMYEGQGILLTGRSGISKTSLAKALGSFNGKFISNDRTAIIRIGNVLIGGQGHCIVRGYSIDSGHKTDEKRFVPITTVIDMTLDESLKYDEPDMRCTILKGETIGEDVSLPWVLSGFGDGIYVKNLFKARMPRSVINFYRHAEWIVNGISEHGVTVTSGDPMQKLFAALNREIDFGELDGMKERSPEQDAKDDLKPSKGSAASLLRWMHKEKIFADNPKKSNELAGMRGGNDSQRTIQKELRTLKAVGLVEGDNRTGYYLADWLRKANVAEIIEQNPELNLGEPNIEKQRIIKIRIILRNTKSFEGLDLSLPSSDDLSVLSDKSGRLDTIRDKYPQVYSLLFNSQNAKRFFSILTDTRRSIDFSIPSDNEMPALQFALENRLCLHIAGNIYAAPVSESFHRYIVFEMDPQSGKAVLAVEIKIPGTYSDRRNVLKEGFTLARQFKDEYADSEELSARMIDPVAFITYPHGNYHIYGEDINFPEGSGAPFNIVIYDYINCNGKRIANLGEKAFKNIALRYPKYGGDPRRVGEEIVKQIIQIIAQMHFLGFGGRASNSNNGLHVENFRIICGEDDFFVKHVGDLEKYEDARLAHEKTTRQKQICDDLRNIFYFSDNARFLCKRILHKLGVCLDEDIIYKQYIEARECLAEYFNRIVKRNVSELDSLKKKLGDLSNYKGSPQEIKVLRMLDLRRRVYLERIIKMQGEIIEDISSNAKSPVLPKVGVQSPPGMAAGKNRRDSSPFAEEFQIHSDFVERLRKNKKAPYPYKLRGTTVRVMGEIMDDRTIVITGTAENLIEFLKALSKLKEPSSVACIDQNYGSYFSMIKWQEKTREIKDRKLEENGLDIANFERIYFYADNDGKPYLMYVPNAYPGEKCQDIVKIFTEATDAAETGKPILPSGIPIGGGINYERLVELAKTKPARESFIDAFLNVDINTKESETAANKATKILLSSRINLSPEQEGAVLGKILDIYNRVYKWLNSGDEERRYSGPLNEELKEELFKMYEKKIMRLISNNFTGNSLKKNRIFKMLGVVASRYNLMRHSLFMHIIYETWWKLCRFDLENAFTAASLWPNSKAGVNKVKKFIRIFNLLVDNNRDFFKSYYRDLFSNNGRYVYLFAKFISDTYLKRERKGRKTKGVLFIGTGAKPLFEITRLMAENSEAEFMPDNLRYVDFTMKMYVYHTAGEPDVTRPEMIVKYLYDNGFFDFDEVVVVDCGRKGTIGIILQNILRDKELLRRANSIYGINIDLERKRSIRTELLFLEKGEKGRKCLFSKGAGLHTMIKGRNYLIRGFNDVMEEFSQDSGERGRISAFLEKFNEEGLDIWKEEGSWRSILLSELANFMDQGIDFHKIDYTWEEKKTDVSQLIKISPTKYIEDADGKVKPFFPNRSVIKLRDLMIETMREFYREKIAANARISGAGRTDGRETDVKAGEDNWGWNTVSDDGKTSIENMVSVPIYAKIHGVLKEKEASPKAPDKDSRRRTGVANEYYMGRTETTYRYGGFFGDETHIRYWPKSSLVKENVLAEWMDRLVSLGGKTVIHYGAEYYPFFGIEAAKRGANTVLADHREIKYVEEVINGRRFSLADYKKAEECLRTISPFSPVVEKYVEQLLKLRPYELIQLVVRVNLHIPEKVWEDLTDAEKVYYIMSWIKSNPGFALGADRYFSGSDKAFWALDDEEKLPYLIEFVQDNYSDTIKQDIKYTALSLLQERMMESLTDAQKFSHYFYHIYGRLISDYYYRFAQDDKQFEDEFNKIVRKVLLSSDKAVRDKIKSHISHMYGKEIMNIGLEDNSVDVICATYAIDRISDTVRFAQGVQRVLRPGGYFVGYVKQEGGEQGRKRVFHSPQVIRDALMNIGFSDEDIVVVEYKDEFPNTIPSYPTEYLFFARRGEKFSSKSIEGLLPLDNRKGSNLVRGSSLILRDLPEEEEVGEALPIEKTAERDVTLSQLTEKLINYRTENPESYKKLIESLFVLLFGDSYVVDENTFIELANERINIDNLLRYLTFRFKSFSELEKAVESLSLKDAFRYILDDLKQFYLIREEIKKLLTDLAMYFDNVNLVLPAGPIENRILERAKILGGDRLAGEIQKILNIPADPEIPLKEKVKRLDAEQEVLYKYFREYNFFFSIGYKLGVMTYSKHEHPDKPPENTAYEITSIIGEYLNVSIITVNGATYYVDKIYRSISTGKREIAGQFYGGSDALSKRYLVYVDSIYEIYNSIKDEYERDRIFGALIKKQWGPRPSRESIINGWINSASLHEIIHDHYPNLGELPSFLAQLAYGPAPFDDLFRNILALQELEREGDIEQVIFRLNKENAASPHYKASRHVVARYLGYILDNGKINIEELRRRIGKLVYFKDSQWQLNEDAAVKDIAAITAALCYLSEGDVRSIAGRWLKDEFKFELSSPPKEITLHLPIFNERFSAEKEKQELAVTGLSHEVLRKVMQAFVEDQHTNLPVLRGKTLPQVAEGALNKTNIPSTRLDRAEAVTDLAVTLMDSNPEGAITLVRDGIDQRFQRGKALLKLAKSAEEQGDIDTSLTLLREAEGILSSKGGLDVNSPASVLGGQFFNLDEIISLKLKLGLAGEALDLLKKYEELLLNCDIRDLSNTRICLLIKVELEKGKTGKKLNDEKTVRDAIDRLTEIEKVVSKFTYAEAREARLIEIALAKGELGELNGAKVILDNILKEEVGWVNGNTHIEAARAKVTLGFKEEGLRNLENLKKARTERPNQVGIVEDYLYPIIGSVKAELGLIDEAREDFAVALSEEVQSKRSEGDNWGILNTVKEMLKHKELLDDSRDATQKIRDFGKRTLCLIDIALEYVRCRQTEKAQETLCAAEKIAENITDDSMQANLRLRIVTEKRKITLIQHGFPPGRVLDTIQIQPEKTDLDEVNRLSKLAEQFLTST